MGSVVIVGDAHLGHAAGDDARGFHRFLEAVPGTGDHLVLTGDLFEFWFEYRSVISRSAFATLTALAAVRQRGVQLTVIGGNHDRWGGSVWRDVGAAFHPHGADLDLAGFRAHAVHGDGLPGGGPLSRILSAVANHPAARSLVRLTHPDLAFWLIRRFSARLGKSTRMVAELDRLAAVQAIWAREYLTRHAEVQVLVVGHSHRPALEMVAERRWYLNPGAWGDGGRYAVVTERGPELRRFE